MGILQSRPEEPDEWAGLPAEPWEPPTAAETLAAPLDAALTLGDPAAASISIALDLPQGDD